MQTSDIRSPAKSIRTWFGGVLPFLKKGIWNSFPHSLVKFRLIYWYGELLHVLSRLRATWRQNHTTWFFRNRPQLELIRRLTHERPHGSTLRIAVLACSNGAEVYSVLWTIRATRPDLKVTLRAVDISNGIVQIAREGVYRFKASELVPTRVFERTTQEEMRSIFDSDGDLAKIKTWLKEGIHWQVGDAGDPELLKLLGSQDLVIANNFLCIMKPPNAERCLRNLARLVDSGGYLVVSGIDLRVRTKVALASGWTPVRDLLEEVHDGDPSIRIIWPWKYCGLEPLNKRKADWKIRYASVFQIEHKK